MKILDEDLKSCKSRTDEGEQLVIYEIEDSIFAINSRCKHRR